MTQQSSQEDKVFCKYCKYYNKTTGICSFWPPRNLFTGNDDMPTFANKPYTPGDDGCCGFWTDKKETK